jgi:superfamily I DNA and/or RNA helicase
MGAALLPLFKIIIMKKILYFFIFLLFINTGCEDENEETEKFDIVYKTLINDEKNELVWVTFYANTYFPNENETVICSTGKSKYRDIFEENYLKRYDSILYIPDIPGYNGCITYMEVTFYFLDTLNILPKTYIIHDTIEAEKTISFIWPQDTLNFK